MCILTRSLWIALALLPLSPAFSLAQLARGQGSRLWPAPVRSSSPPAVRPVEAQLDGNQLDGSQLAGNQTVGDQATANQTAGYPNLVPLNTLRTTPQPHRVIRAPGRRADTANRHAKKIPHPPHHGLHRRIQPQPAMIPDANQRETWKCPFSYGYFGASRTRHWSMHFGYRDRYTEWRLK